MLMSFRLRSFTLVLHVLSSIGWIGALSAFLVLSVIGLASRDAEAVRAAYMAMDPITRFAIIPLALAAFLTGVVQALGTPWGLVRHYWVFFKLLIVAASAFMLLGKAGPIAHIASVAAETGISGDDLLGLRLSIAAHAVGGLAALIWAAALGMYKPQATTPYGARKEGVRRVQPAGR